MASTSSSGRGPCKRNVAGKMCQCQEWEASSEIEFLCDCCGCHLSFHEPYHPVNSGFGRCLKEFGEEGSSQEDGCQEFFPSVANARRCGGCGCHRNIHRKVMAIGKVASSFCDWSQQTLHVDYSAALMEPSSKRLNLERANNSESINVGDFSKTVETDDGMSSTDSCRNPKW